MRKTAAEVIHGDFSFCKTDLESKYFKVSYSFVLHPEVDLFKLGLNANSRATAHHFPLY